MSQNDETASSVEHDAQSIDSVYDFLYHDARRVGSFISQMDASGHLTSLKQTETAESGSGMKATAYASGTMAIVRGGGTLEDQRTANERESLERTYDPIWTNALALLDMLDERNMIRDGLSSARIGQFVKVCRATIKTVSPATISDTSIGGISLKRAAGCQVRSRHRRWPERPDFTGGCPLQMLGRRCYLKLNILIPAVAV